MPSGVYKRKPGWTSPTSFIKGDKPWNTGKKMSLELKRRISKKLLGRFVGKNAFNWKGSKAGYSALHAWVRRKLGDASKCVNGHKAKQYHWANISGKYLRKLSDWHQLCQSCNFRDGVKVHKRFK